MADQNVKINLVVEGSQLAREINASIAQLQRLASVTSVTNKDAVAETQASIAAQHEYMLSVNASADAFARLDKVQMAFGARVEATATRSAGSLNSMARGFSVIESSAHASVRSIDAISNAAAQLAFGFGPQGLLIGSAVMVGIAIVRAFESAKDAVTELRKKAETEFQALGISLSKEAAAQQFRASQAAYDAQVTKVAELQRKIGLAMSLGGALGETAATYYGHAFANAKVELGELNAEADKYYAIWQGLDKLDLNAPAREAKDEAKARREALAAMKEQMKLLAEYTAKYGGDAIYNKFLKENEKVKKFSPGSDITQDALKIKPPTIDKTEFQTELNGIRAYSEGLKQVASSAKLMQTVAGGAFAALLGSVGALTGGAQAMKRALLEPIATWLKATAIKEFVAGMADLANPFTHIGAAAHFKAAAEATAGFAIVSAIAGGGGGGGGGGSSGGSGGGGSSAGSSATALGAGSKALNSGPMVIELVVTQKDMDGKTVSRLRQKFQRADDKAQPIRAVL